MKCDKCLNEINERAGYITLMSRYEGVLSVRNPEGQLMSRVIASGGQTKRFCYTCAKENAELSKGEEK